jgi:hypothetical protein
MWNVAQGRARLIVTMSGTMLIYAIVLIGLVVVLALGVPLMERLVNLAVDA